MIGTIGYTAPGASGPFGYVPVSVLGRLMGRVSGRAVASATTASAKPAPASPGPVPASARIPGGRTASGVPRITNRMDGGIVFASQRAAASDRGPRPAHEDAGDGEPRAVDERPLQPGHHRPGPACLPQQRPHAARPADGGVEHRRHGPAAVQPLPRAAGDPARLAALGGFARAHVVGAPAPHDRPDGPRPTGRPSSACGRAGSRTGTSCPAAGAHRDRAGRLRVVDAGGQRQPDRHRHRDRRPAPAGGLLDVPRAPARRAHAVRDRQRRRPRARPGGERPARVLQLPGELLAR